MALADALGTQEFVEEHFPDPDNAIVGGGFFTHASIVPVSVAWEDSGIDGGSGIDVEGSNSLVTGNTTNMNLDVGLDVQCPGTVTNNNSSGNGGLNYVFEGPGVCFMNNNP